MIQMTTSTAKTKLKRIQTKLKKKVRKIEVDEHKKKSKLRHTVLAQNVCTQFYNKMETQINK